MDLDEKVKKPAPPPERSAFVGEQLSLFQTFLCNTEEERDKLSNTIEFWDGVPKYFVSRKQMTASRNEDGYLPIIKRDFDYGGRAFSVEIRPARIIDDQGKEKEFYPSVREELVEDALRKIASEQKFGFYEDNPKNRRSGVVFSLYLLRQELAKRGHSVSYQQVRESLYILHDARLDILSADGKAIFKSSILQTLAGVSRDQIKNDKTSKWYAEFCPFVTESIKCVTYRQFDYDAMMHHSSQMARWLHKRLSHNYINAGYMTPYTFLFSSARRDSGLLGEAPEDSVQNVSNRYKRERDAIRSLDQAIEELQQGSVIINVAREEKKGAHNRIFDVKYTLLPHPDFVKQVKAANKRLSDGRKVAQRSGGTRLQSAG